MEIIENWGICRDQSFGVFLAWGHAEVRYCRGWAVEAKGWSTGQETQIPFRGKTVQHVWGDEAVMNCSKTCEIFVRWLHLWGCAERRGHETTGANQMEVIVEWHLTRISSLIQTDWFFECRDKSGRNLFGTAQEWMATAQIGKLPRLPKERDLEVDGTPKERTLATQLMQLQGCLMDWLTDWTWLNRLRGFPLSF